MNGFTVEHNSAGCSYHIKERSHENQVFVSRSWIIIWGIKRQMRLFERASNTKPNLGKNNQY